MRPARHFRDLPVTVGGETLTVREWAERNGLAPHTIHKRLLSGWEPARAVTEPTRAEFPTHPPLTIDGVTASVATWARKNGIHESTAYKRIADGWDPIRAVTEPAGAIGSHTMRVDHPWRSHNARGVTRGASPTTRPQRTICPYCQVPDDLPHADDCELVV